MLFRWRDYTPGHTCFGAEPGVAAGHAHARKAACPADPRGARHNRGAVWQRSRARRRIIGACCLLGTEDARGPSEIAGATNVSKQTNPNAPEIPASGRGLDAGSWAGRRNRRGSRLRVERRVFNATRTIASGLFTTVLVLFFLLVSGDTFLRRLVEILPRYKDK